jgi:hypothetical protein
MSAKLQAAFRTVFGEIGAAQGQVVATLADVEVFVGDLLKANGELLEALKAARLWISALPGSRPETERLALHARLNAIVSEAEGES